MKRSVLLGLFVTASMMASTSFAASDDLCATNLQTIENAKAQIQAKNMQSKVDASVQQAKAHQAMNTKEGTEKCIAETQQTIQELQKTSSSNN